MNTKIVRVSGGMMPRSLIQQAVLNRSNHKKQFEIEVGSIPKSDSKGK